MKLINLILSDSLTFPDKNLEKMTIVSEKLLENEQLENFQKVSASLEYTSETHTQQHTNEKCTSLNDLNVVQILKLTTAGNIQILGFDRFFIFIIFNE